MHDIAKIRDNPDVFDQALKRRHIKICATDILALDSENRALITQGQALQAERNRLTKIIGEKKKQGLDGGETEEHLRTIRTEIRTVEKKQETVSSSLKSLMEKLPNNPDEDVPVGADETENLELYKKGAMPDFSFEAKPHEELGGQMMDFVRSARISGARFVCLEDQLARMERALAAFMLDIHCQEFGYREILPPVLIKPEALYGTGHLPKFKEDLFQTETGAFLIPTAETWLTNYIGDDILEEDKTPLPIRLTAWTPCFRSEAGAAGRDTKGMFRLHQFSKVELVSITRPEESEAELERMTSCAEEILKRLGLPYRVVLLCTGDMGFSAAKTLDIEVWLPSQQRYREISSCSNCRDFQARRMKSRYRPRGDKKTFFLHTLNGSALALGRTIIAVMENYQNKDGSITVPEILRAYMNGLSVIRTQR